MTCRKTKRGDFENGTILEVSNNSDVQRPQVDCEGQRLLFDNDKFKMAVTGANSVTVGPRNRTIGENLMSAQNLHLILESGKSRTESRNHCPESSFQSRIVNVVFRLSLGQKIELAQGLGQKPDFRDEWH